MEHIIFKAYSIDKYNIRIFKINESDTEREIRCMDTAKQLSRLVTTKKEAV